MNEEIDDSEFYHQDFTTASEWEVFIARMEEIINQWKTEDQKDDQSTDIQNIWEIRTEKLSFADVDFTLKMCRKKIESPDSSESSDEIEKPNKNPMDSLYDFELYDERSYTDTSCISAWYGLNDFVVLSPLGNIGITSESKIKVLLSSAYVVAKNVHCDVPILVQIRDKWQKCYLGVYEGEGIRTNFEMIHLKRGPTHCQYLTGLLDLFKTKIMSPCSIDTVMVSVQHSYTLMDFGNFIWKQDPLGSDHFDVETLFVLPLGVTVDPISAIVLKTTWNLISDHLVVDSENYSDFEPMAAPKWSCLTRMTSEPVCLLGECLAEFLENLNNNSTVHDILGDFTMVQLPENNPLDLLTEPAVPTITTLLNRVARNSISRGRRGQSQPVIQDSVLVPLLYFLFPDADENTNFPYGGKEDKESGDKSRHEELLKNLEEEFRAFKTCAVDSLMWRLSIVLGHALQSLGGTNAFAHMWYEFVQEMRFRWEKSTPTPGLAPGFPDFRTCLLNQKLQMLNCCIERKLARDNARHSTYDSAEDSSTDDEFYDCLEKMDEESKKKASSPVGRLGKFGDLKLLNTGEPLYIPITQEPVLKTEDQLEEDTDVLLKLGSNAEASELRARIMSASLQSDMEAFKAANPGSVVEDFIRWYSPRDWIEDEDTDEWGQKKGHLSPRMLIEENNIWVQMWESAKPVPANRQKRLFDDTREAERILQFLEMRTVGQVCELVIPVLAHGAICRLIEECQVVASELPEATVRISSILRHGERISRDVIFQPRRVEAFIVEVTALELLVSQVNSLQYKLNPSGAADAQISDLVGKLVVGKEVDIKKTTNSNIGCRLMSMFSDAQKPIAPSRNDQVGETAAISMFPAPSEREFVMRVNAVKPASYSSKCPQFMRAVLNRNEFRITGAFSEDIVFF